MLLTRFEENAQPFLRLEDLILSPPLPAIVALLVVLGTLYLSRRVAPRLFGRALNLVEFAAAFVVTAGIIAAFVHALAWAGYASISALRFGGWTLATLGVIELFTLRVGAAKHFLYEYFREVSLVERCALALSAVTLIGLVSAALGPAVDADSLDYHLGVPLEWLRHGGAYPTPDWFTSRYVGLGESLNMLGLAAGTDGLGAAFQVAGVVVAIVAVTALANNRANQLFAVVLVIGCPVIFLLTVGQKPQMLPAAALTLALVILVTRSKRLDIPIAVLAFGCIAFAMASKHSYLLSGSVVVLIGLVMAVRAQRLRLALLALTACFALFALPIFARNFVFYGDPLSPLLERWRPDADPVIIAFAQQALRDYGGGPVTLGRVARLPWDLAFTLTPGQFQHVLGLGAFGFVFSLRERGVARLMLVSALSVFALVVLFGQVTPRFFLDCYLWCAAATAAAPWHHLKSFFFHALTAQAAVTAAVAVYLGIVICPGALTQSGRDRVMTKMALGYAEAKWLDARLPANAVMVSTTRSYALLPRPFAFPDPFLPWSPSTSEPVSAASNWREKLTDLVKEKKVTVLVTEYPIKYAAFSWLATNYGTPFAGPTEFRFAARSPFNRGNLISSLVTKLDLESTSGRVESLP